MRILLHDFCGYAFIFELGRELAKRGHEVWQVYCPQYPLGQGMTRVQPDDPQGFRILPLELDATFERYSPAKRLRDEVIYGRKAAKLIRELSHSDVVISANTPLIVQAFITVAARSVGASFIFWAQDLLGVGSAAVLAKRGAPGRAVGWSLRQLERWLLRKSDHVVAIAHQFRAAILGADVPTDNVSIIPNWAPLGETPVRPKDNPWAKEHGLRETFNFLYSGTLGLKHNPELLVHIAAAFGNRDDVRVVLVSEGRGADQVRRMAIKEGHSNILVLPFQPYASLPDVLGTADVLVALLQPEASLFSVPSKVLTYHCAGRPILAAMPSRNLASMLIVENGSGLVVDPKDNEALARGAREMFHLSPSERARMEKAARTYAEEVFNIRRIAGDFERVFEKTRLPR